MKSKSVFWLTWNWTNLSWNQHPNSPNSSKSSQSSEQKPSRVRMQTFFTLQISEVWIKKGSWQRFLEKHLQTIRGPKIDRGLTFDVWSPAHRYIKMSMGSKWCKVKGKSPRQDFVFNLLASRTCLPCSSEFVSTLFSLCQTWLILWISCKERGQKVSNDPILQGGKYLLFGDLQGLQSKHASSWLSLF